MAGFVSVLSQLLTPEVISKVRHEFMHLSAGKSSCLSRNEFVAVLLPITSHRCGLDPSEWHIFVDTSPAATAAWYRTCHHYPAD
jgi:hypothetical protein